MLIRLQTLKNLIRESFLMEAECPSCGDSRAYVGFTSVECPNGDCEHYDGSEQSLAKLSWEQWLEEIRRLHDEEGLDWDEPTQEYQAEYDSYYDEWKSGTTPEEFMRWSAL
jgi:hypothetical protein